MQGYKVNIPADVHFILDRLCRFGYTAHIVGGCVRDMLIGLIPSDYDITTSATPDEVKKVFSDFRIIDTGIKHGTVTLICSDLPYEITTYRTEGAYTDNRHPDSVSFTRTLSLDLSRRDFTINAMCADKDGEVVDLFGGIEHIGARVISAVGCARERFFEDSLRILRALRFSATLGFTLDKQTDEAVRDCRELLKNISVERSYSELIKMLGGKYAHDVLSRYADVIKTVLPELSRLSLPDKSRFDTASDKLRLASLFAVGSEEPAVAFEAAMRRMHTDTKTRRLGVCALTHLSYPMESDTDLLKLLYRVGVECAEFTVGLRALLSNDDGVVQRLFLAEKTGKPYKISDMAAGGEVFALAGFRGEEIGMAIERTLYAIIDAEIKNTEEEISKYAGELKKGGRL